MSKNSFKTPLRITDLRPFTFHENIFINYYLIYLLMELNIENNLGINSEENKNIITSKEAIELKLKSETEKYIIF